MNCPVLQAVKVRGLRYPHGELAVLHEPRLLAQSTAEGAAIGREYEMAA